MPPPGRYYNLGRTGLRVELVADAPMHLVARHFFAELAASGRVEVGDHIVGVAGQSSTMPHRNGHGRRPDDGFLLVCAACSNL